jgi:hypothetical protein
MFLILLLFSSLSSVLSGLRLIMALYMVSYIWMTWREVTAVNDSISRLEPGDISYYYDLEAFRYLSIRLFSGHFSTFFWSLSSLCMDPNIYHCIGRLFGHHISRSFYVCRGDSIGIEELSALFHSLKINDKIEHAPVQIEIAVRQRF